MGQRSRRISQQSEGRGPGVVTGRSGTWRVDYVQQRNVWDPALHSRWPGVCMTVGFTSHRSGESHSSSATASSWFKRDGARQAATTEADPFADEVGHGRQSVELEAPDSRRRRLLTPDSTDDAIAAMLPHDQQSRRATETAPRRARPAAAAPDERGDRRLSAMIKKIHQAPKHRPDARCVRKLAPSTWVA